MGKRAKDPTERRNEFIEEATKLFIENGYEKTTVEMIIQKVGVAKGSFYNYFNSKEEIFEACIINLAEKMVLHYQSIFSDQTKTAKEKLIQYIDYNFRLAFQEQSADLAKAIHSAHFAAMHEQIMKKAVKKIIPSFIQLIEQGINEGDFHVKDAEFTAVAMMGAFQEIHELFAKRLDEGMDKPWGLIMDLLERLLQTKLTHDQP